MVKNLLMFPMLGMALAMPATALAGEFDWLGTTADFGLASNYSGDPEQGGYDTMQLSYDPGDMNGSYEPVIATGNDTQWGYARMRNSITVTQTGGVHRWMNGTGDNCAGLSIYNGALLDMSGGTHITDQLLLGARRNYEWVYSWDAGSINVWGGALKVQENPFVEDLYDLYIDDDGSVIDLRNTGVLEVPLSLQSTVDGYIASGAIVAGAAGTTLDTRVDVPDDKYIVSVVPDLGGDFDIDGDVDGNDFLVWQQGFGTDYDANDLTEWQTNFGAPGAGLAAVATAVPEPASAMLALLGLGLFAVAQRRKNRSV